MSQLSITTLVLALAAIGLGVAVIALLRTPRDQWFSTGRGSVQDLILTLPASREARIIEADRRRAVVQAAPWVLPLGISALVAFVSEVVGPDQCTTIWGFDWTFINLVVIAYVLPGSVLAMTFSMFGQGMKVVTHKYCPPLDSAQFRDTIAVKGWASRLRGYLMIISPLFGISCMYLGHHAFVTILQGRTISNFQLALQQSCAA